MPVGKTLLSVFAFALFGTYAWYENMHGGKADLITLIQQDLALRAQAQIGTDVALAPTQQVRPAVGMNPDEYSRYLAQINAQAADYARTHPRKVAEVAPIIRKEREEEEHHEEFEDDDDDDDRFEHERRVVQPKKVVAAIPKVAPPITQPTTPVGPQYTDTPVNTPVDVVPQQPVTLQPIVEQPVVDPTPMPTAPQGQYRDGSYTGKSVDVFYGPVQVRADIQNGLISDVVFLQYPTDRRTSQNISNQAMPILKQEAIAAQSANVDGVSGATAISEGFRTSLASALADAHL